MCIPCLHISCKCAPSSEFCALHHRTVPWICRRLTSLSLISEEDCRAIRSHLGFHRWCLRHYLRRAFKSGFHRFRKGLNCSVGSSPGWKWCFSRGSGLRIGSGSLTHPLFFGCVAWRLSLRINFFFTSPSSSICDWSWARSWRRHRGLLLAQAWAFLFSIESVVRRASIFSKWAALLRVLAFSGLLSEFACFATGSPAGS